MKNKITLASTMLIIVAATLTGCKHTVSTDLTVEPTKIMDSNTTEIKVECDSVELDSLPIRKGVNEKRFDVEGCETITFTYTNSDNNATLDAERIATFTLGSEYVNSDGHVYSEFKLHSNSTLTLEQNSSDFCNTVFDTVSWSTNYRPL